MTEAKHREIWVDNVKGIACILVVFGHFFQSMTKAGILPANDLYKWFNQTIYYFPVPLFFICSGYLYQKRSIVDELHSWGRNVLKKALNLGVPYFTFSFATWLLKSLFSDAVNKEIGGMLDTLFLHPTSPYWYLYALFFIYLITPTFKNKRIACAGLAVATAMKVLGFTGMGCGVEAVSYVLSNEIWFVIGMCLSVFDIMKPDHEEKCFVPALFAAVLFLALSVVVYVDHIQLAGLSFLLGILSCFAVVMVVGYAFRKNHQLGIFGFLAQYTMPIYVMHTLFAAPLRIALLRAGIVDAAVHVVLGIAISLIGPVIAAIVMKKSKWLAFFLYPGKVIKSESRNER